MEDFEATPPARPRAKANQREQQQFDMDELRKMQNLQQVLSYVGNTLSNAYLGEGQGRVVYRVWNGMVLKVAKNEGGIGQNQAEATVCKGAEHIANLFPKVSEEGPGHLWLVTEEASPMTPELFLKLTGMPWDRFVAGLGGAFAEKRKNPSEVEKQAFIDLSNNPFFSKLIQVIKECKYEPGDIAKMDSWGMIKGHPVIIDSGFTEAVHQSYYSKG